MVSCRFWDFICDAKVVVEKEYSLRNCPELKGFIIMKLKIDQIGDFVYFQEDWIRRTGLERLDFMNSFAFKYLLSELLLHGSRKKGQHPI